MFVALSTNGFLVWLLAHRDVFEGVVELADTIDRSSSPPGSIQEAILCFHGMNNRFGLLSITE